MSLLFETTDERRTGQAYAKSHVGITCELHYMIFFVITSTDLQPTLKYVLAGILPSLPSTALFFRFILFIAK